jgi:basic membrane protein A
MLKRTIALLLVLVLVISSFAACGNNNENNNNGNNGNAVNAGNNAGEDKVMYEDNKVGMVTDMGTIDDKSFNQGTWEGIERIETDFSAQIKYLKPTGFTTDDYLTEIGNLVDAGYEIIVTPGFKFEEAIYKAQAEYPQIMFVLIDGTPNDANWGGENGPDFKIADNTISVLFAEHESGFLAGVAAALETKTNKLGFIGGMAIPPVQKFGWGFVAGVAYANENFGTEAEVVEYIYQGSFDQVDAGAQLAASMYDEGVDIIFAAAGGVGIGAINESKTRKAAGDAISIIGVDVDQYTIGMLEDGTSAVLTSAMKRIDNAAYDYVLSYLEGNFPGGTQIVMDAKNGGVGLPAENPNLAENTISKADEALKGMADGSIVVPSTVDELTTYLEGLGYTTAAGVEY